MEKETSYECLPRRFTLKSSMKKGGPLWFHFIKGKPLFSSILCIGKSTNTDFNGSNSNLNYTIIQMVIVDPFSYFYSDILTDTDGQDLLF